jgi:hypothetical protein
MNFVEIILTEKLKDADPALDVTGSDRKVLQVACQDFTNYLKYQWNLIGQESSNCVLAVRIEQFFKENPAELEAFLTVWTGIWLKKWKERVKLLIGTQNTNKWNKVAKTLCNAEPMWRKQEHKEELTEMVVSTLVKNGEICGTEILSENLLKMEMGELGDKPNPTIDQKEQILNVLNNALRKARDMAQSKGPLIFVKIDKAYYGAVNGAVNE